MSDRFESYEQTLRNTLSESKEALTAKGVEVPEETKLRNVPGLIGQVKTGSSVELVITAPDYEGQTLTATKGEKKATGVVTEGVARIPVDEEGTWVVSAEDGNSVEVATDMTFEAELKGSKVYTIAINKNEADPTNRVEYMDDAVGMKPMTVTGTQVNYNGWDQTFFLKKCYPVWLKTNGEVEYKLNPNNYNQRENGDASAVSIPSSDGNAMVCIEKMYTRFWSDSSYEYMSITDKPKDGYVPFGFVGESGSEVDCQYVGMFLGSNINGNLRSLSGQNIMFPASTRSSSFDIRNTALKNGENYGLATWALYQVLDMIFNIIFKTENCSVLGKGRQGAGEVNRGSEGTLPSLKTGLFAESGPIAVDTTSGCVKFMHIEDYFSDRSKPLAEMMDGTLVTSKNDDTGTGTLYIKTQRPYATIAANGQGTTSGYTNQSTFVTKTGNIKTSVLDNNYGRVPSEIGATSSTYECDPIEFSKYISGTHIGVRRGGLRGLASPWINVGFPAHYSRGSCCARLSYEPQTT